LGKNGTGIAVQQLLMVVRLSILLKPAAKNALEDLEIFIAHIQPKKVVRIKWVFLYRAWIHS